MHQGLQQPLRLAAGCIWRPVHLPASEAGEGLRRASAWAASLGLRVCVGNPVCRVCVGNPASQRWVELDSNSGNLGLLLTPMIVGTGGGRVGGGREAGSRPRRRKALKAVAVLAVEMGGRCRESVGPGSGYWAGSRGLRRVLPASGSPVQPQPCPSPATACRWGFKVGVAFWGAAQQPPHADREGAGQPPQPQGPWMGSSSLGTVGPSCVLSGHPALKAKGGSPCSEMLGGQAGGWARGTGDSQVVVKSHVSEFPSFYHFLTHFVPLFPNCAFAFFFLANVKLSLSFMTCEISVSLGFVRRRGDHA